GAGGRPARARHVVPDPRRDLGYRPSVPRVTPEQVRRRQIVAGALVLVLLLAVGGCTAGVIGALRGVGEEQALTESAPFEADDAAMTTPSTPADAAVLANLPEGAELMPGEVMGIDVSSHQREDDRSEEHTSELQSRYDLVCR